MEIRAVEPSRGRVLLLEPNAALRSAILTILTAERFETEVVESLDQALSLVNEADHIVALAAWQTMQGLLAEDHRAELAEINRRLRVVVMVPRRWSRLLEATDLASAVVGLISKPFEADELIETLSAAFAVPAATEADSIVDQAAS
jgi:DNA-binding NtrC family response regulator